MFAKFLEYEGDSLDEYLAGLDQQHAEASLTSIALFNAFLQVNYTGPYIEITGLPTFPLDVILDRLEVDGERPYPLVEVPLCLLLALHLIDKDAEPWWYVRMNFIHQQLLDDPVSTIHNKIFDEERIALIEATSDKARWHLELAHYYSYYSYDQKALTQVAAAQQASGLKMQVSGALGRRTKFQTFDVSQLVVLAKSAKDYEKDQESVPKTLDLNDDTILEKVSFTDTNEEASYRERILPIVPPEAIDPVLAALSPGEQPQLSPIDQCILLTIAGIIKISAASDDTIITEQVAAYVARVLQNKADWTIHSAALLARTRVEGHRSRTVERAVLQLQALVDQLMDETSQSFLRRSESAPAEERLQHLLCLPTSSRWELQKELASKYTSIGLVRSALEIFERLEIWESVAMCYGVMEQEDKAESVLRAQLDSPKPGADINKLWCLLGDVTQDKQYWEKSWDVSNKRYARAQRSLGKYYFSKKQFTNALAAYSLSLKINPLNHSAWFMYGCAALETSNFEVAAEAFTRCVGIDYNDAESWNNLASSLLRLNRPRDAWKALKTATSLKWDSWRMWENYTLISIDIGEIDEAVRGCTRCLQIRPREDAIDVDVLQTLVHHDGKKVYELMMLVQPLITHDPRLWKLLGKVYLSRQRYSDALDAQEKAYRCLNAKTIDTEEVFIELVDAVQDLVDAYTSLGPMDGRLGGQVMPDWKFKARSVVRTLKARARNFEDCKDYERLNDMLPT